MQGFDLKYAVIKLFRMFTSRKFLVLLFGTLAAYQVDIPEDLQALITLGAAGLFAALTAYEDRGEAHIYEVDELE